MRLATFALTLILVCAFEIPLQSEPRKPSLQIEDVFQRLKVIEAESEVPLEDIPIRKSPLLIDFFLNVEIGTPKNNTKPQVFRLSLSMNFETFILIDAICRGMCPTNVYFSNNSMTYQSIMERELDSSLSIELGSDVVSLTADLNVEKLYIVLLKPHAEFGWIAIEDGLFGLAPSYTFSDQSFVQKLAFEKKIENPSFAVFLSKNMTNKSVISFGDSNITKYSTDPVFTQLRCDTMTTDSWVVYSDLSFDGELLTSRAIRTEIKVEVMSIYVPIYIFSNIQQRICTSKAQCMQKSSFTRFKCAADDVFPDLTFTIDQKIVTISEQFYVQRISPDSCWLLIHPTESDVITLGQPLFYAYYLEFNAKDMLIGFAKSTNTMEDRSEKFGKLRWWIVGTAVVLLVIGGIIIFVIVKDKEQQKLKQELETLKLEHEKLKQEHLMKEFTPQE